MVLYLFSVMLFCQLEKILQNTSKVSDHHAGLSPHHISKIVVRASMGHLALFAHVNPLKSIEGSIQRTLVIIVMNSPHTNFKEQKDKWKKSVCDSAKINGNKFSFFKISIFDKLICSIALCSHKNFLLMLCQSLDFAL